MKKTLATLATLATLIPSSAAFATSSVNLTVKGLIVPSACTPTLSANGIADHGKISAKDLNQDTETPLPSITLQMNVKCDAKTLFALQSTDNRASSTTDPTGYGLGLVNDTQKIGNYHLLFKNPLADSAAITLLQSSDNGTTWMNSTGATWPSTHLAAFGDQSGGNGFAPIQIQDLSTDILVNTQIAPASSLDLANEVLLDGSTAVEVKYL